CPQCNSKCALKDVRVLYASQIVAVNEELQKKVRSLEAKCASLEKMGADWCKKEVEWRKTEAGLHLQVHQLTERTCYLEGLLGDQQSKLSGSLASSRVVKDKPLLDITFISNLIGNDVQVASHCRIDN
ncbi:unnamed protein product, partial [Ilex paraguariensis]